jgi:hypothetical protein
VLFALVVAVAGPVIAMAGTLQSSSVAPGLSMRGSALTRLIDAGSVALAGAGMASAEGLPALALNPAGLSRSAGFQASGTFAYLLDGIGSETELASGWGNGSLALAARVALISHGDYEVRDLNGVMSGTSSLRDTVFSVGAGCSNPSWLHVRGSTGITLGGVQEAVGGFIPAASVGTMMQMSQVVTAGAAIRNLGPGKSGYVTPSEAMVAGMWLPIKNLRLMGDFGYGPGDHAVRVAAAAEGALSSMVSVRGGYRFLTGDQAYVSGLNLGFGVRLKNLELDYAYQPIGNLCASHRLTLALVGRPAGAGGH